MPHSGSIVVGVDVGGCYSVCLKIELIDCLPRQYLTKSTGYFNLNGALIPVRISLAIK